MQRKLIVTELDPVPFEFDTIIVAQMLAMVEEGYRPIQVICELWRYWCVCTSSPSLWATTSVKQCTTWQTCWCIDAVSTLPSAPTAISILQIINSLPSNVVSSVLAVPQLFRIGKKKVIKLLKAQDVTHDIENLGNTDPDISWENIESGCIKFMCGLYGNKRPIKRCRSCGTWSRWKRAKWTPWHRCQI